MFYGIERNTDLRNPDTKIHRFSSRSAALRWSSKGGGFAYPGAADADLPMTQQNFHHRIRTVWESPSGWRPPSVAVCRKQVWDHNRHGSIYRITSADVLATAIHSACEQISE